MKNRTLMDLVALIDGIALNCFCSSSQKCGFQDRTEVPKMYEKDGKEIEGRFFVLERDS